MAENWTDVTTQDDPAMGHRAVELGRVHRDNDDCNTRIDQIFQAAGLTVTGLNQTYPNVVGTGIKVRFFKPAFVDKVSFKYYVASRVVGGVRHWSKVRFNFDTNLETTLNDTNVSGTGLVTITDFDLSSLAEGSYEAEIFVGATCAAGDQFIVRLPSGADEANTQPPSEALDNFTLECFKWNTIKWTTSPSSNLTDTELAADKGHTKTVGKMWYDRDEKLRRRPAGCSMAEFSEASAVHPTFADKGVFAKVYVPKSADVLLLRVECKVTSGNTGRISINPVEADNEGSPYSFHSVNVNEVAFPTNTSYAIHIIRVNVSRWRGQTVQLKLRMNNSAGGHTVWAKIQDTFQGHNWESGPLPSQQPIAIPWRLFPAAAYDQGALLHAAWWRRIALRDRDLLERQMLQRGFNITRPSSTSSDVNISSSRMRLYQPKGATKLTAICEVANPNSFVSSLAVDYFDRPDGQLYQQSNVLAGVWEVTKPLRADRAGTTQEFAIFFTGGTTNIVYRCLDLDRARMRWHT